VLAGALFAVAASDGAQNAVIKAATQGVFDSSKEPALVITAGARFQAWAATPAEDDPAGGAATGA
jgi:predicted RecA/RadA family phage recombinase